MNQNTAAFGLVVLAGLCAPLGACVVLFIHRLKHKHMLSAGLGLSAGVMVLVSLAEAFFAGVLLCFLLDVITDGSLQWIAHRHRNKGCGHCCSSANGEKCTEASNGEQQLPCSLAQECEVNKACMSTAGNHGRSGIRDSAAMCSSEAGKDCNGTSVVLDLLGSNSSSSGDDVCPSSGPVTADEDHLRAAAEELTAKDSWQLLHTSILIGLALSFHNLPEGLATYVGYMSSPHLGITIAIAIAVHNIPEGIAVGVPIYFATGSRWKAIGWAAVSGLAEPLGALIGFCVQASGHLSPVAMGIIMATVAGIMIGITFRELIPKALSYDPGNRYTSNAVFAGMAVMGLSLVLLALWDTSA